MVVVGSVVVVVGSVVVVVGVDVVVPGFVVVVGGVTAAASGTIWIPSGVWNVGGFDARAESMLRAKWSLPPRSPGQGPRWKNEKPNCL